MSHLVKTGEIHKNQRVLEVSSCMPRLTEEKKGKRNYTYNAVWSR
jgi:hypothetical protein